MTRFPLSLPLRAALHAGLGGAWHGGHPGDPRVGVAVPVRTPAELAQACKILEAADVQATLLIVPMLAAQMPGELRKAAARHEVGGLGDLAGLTGLEAAAGRPVTVWATPEHVRALAGLRQHHLRALPVSASTAAPGALLQVAPAELGAALAKWTALGYRPVPVREVPELRAGQPRDLLLRTYTRLVEDRFAREHAVIDLAQRADAVMRVAALDHAPLPLPLPPGTPTAELHLHSPRIVGLASRSALVAYRAYRRSLKDVAQAMQTRPELAGAQAVFAVTLFHGPLAQAGFELLELPPLQARWYGLGFRLLRAAYGTRRAPSEGRPKMAWLSREEFLRRHG